MTLTQAKLEVQHYNQLLRLVHIPEYREYQVRVKGLPEATYFTDCIDDAVNTARSMAREIASHFGGRA